MPEIWTWFLAIVAVIFIALELFAHFTHKIPTLSQLIWRWERIYPIIPFLLGLIVGILIVHFFGTNACPPA